MRKARCSTRTLIEVNVAVTLGLACERVLFGGAEIEKLGCMMCVCSDWCFRCVQRDRANTHSTSAPTELSHASDRSRHRPSDPPSVRAGAPSGSARCFCTKSRATNSSLGPPGRMARWAKTKSVPLGLSKLLLGKWVNGWVGRCPCLSLLVSLCRGLELPTGTLIRPHSLLVFCYCLHPPFLLNLKVVPCFLSGEDR